MLVAIYIFPILNCSDDSVTTYIPRETNSFSQNTVYVIILDDYTRSTQHTSEYKSGWLFVTQFLYSNSKELTVVNYSRHDSTTIDSILYKITKLSLKYK